jgi:hypothetical protein
MNLKILSNQLKKIYNTLGNEWLVSNFKTEPFVFSVFVRRGDEMDVWDYVVEVYSHPQMPNAFEYKDELNKPFDGVDISVVRGKFKEFINYVESFGGFQKTIGVEFMDRKPYLKS